MVVVDSKDNLQDPNVRTEAISGTNLFGFKDKFESLDQEEIMRDLVQSTRGSAIRSKNSRYQRDTNPSKTAGNVAGTGAQSNTLQTLQRERPLDPQASHKQPLTSGNHLKRYAAGTTGTPVKGSLYGNNTAHKEQNLPAERSSPTKNPSNAEKKFQTPAEKGKDDPNKSAGGT